MNKLVKKIVLCALVLTMTWIYPNISVFAEDSIVSDSSEISQLESYTSNDAENKETEESKQVSLNNEENIIYVSQSGEGDGLSLDSPKAFASAMNDAKGGDTFILIEDITLTDQWDTPNVGITVKGINEQIVLTLKSGSYIDKNNGASIILNGSLKMDTICLKTINNKNTLLIVANGNNLVFEKGVNMTSSATKYIFGGGYYTDTKSTSLTINSKITGRCYIYAGGCYSNVDGDTNLIMNDSNYDTVYGGGYYGNVSGNTNVEIIGGSLISTGRSIYGGGNEGVVSGNTNVSIQNIGTDKANFYGGGNNGDIGGNTNIEMKGCHSTGNKMYFHAAGKESNVLKNVNMTVTNCDFKTNIGADKGFFAGASGDGIVYGTATINFVDNKDYLVVHAGGYKGSTEMVGKVNINITNTKFYRAFTVGTKDSIVHDVDINLYDGGANREPNAYPDSYLNNYSYDEQYSDIKTKKPLGEVNVNVYGDTTWTQIDEFPNIHIFNQAVLNERATEKNLFNNCDNVTIDEGGSLNLLQDNEIKGNFKSSGNLSFEDSQNPDAKLIVDGTVTSYEGASYTSADFATTYSNSSAFLQMKGDSDKQAQFTSTNENYYVSHRDSKDDGIKQEWYLVQPVVIGLKDQTIYTGGEDNENEYGQFPEPIYTGLLEDVTYCVDGKEFEPSEEHLYPWSVQYMDENQDIITDDTQAGDYIARIVPDGKITLLDGSPVEFTDGQLRIRYVSNVEEAENNEIVYNALYQEPSQLDEGKAVVVLDKESKIYLNDTDIEVKDTSGIALMFDNILGSPDGEEERIKLLKEKAEDLGFKFNDEMYQFKYLDLVDTHNSNAWVSSEKGSTIYWAYPKGTNQNTEFKLLHYQGLHREYGFDGEDDVFNAIENCTVEEVSIEKTETGIVFHVNKSGFSPFVLMWSIPSSVINEIPVIKAENQTIEVGTEFDVMKNVTAHDSEDGDLTAEIKVIKNTVDTKVVGEYEVVYMVTDSQGASTTKTIIVKVVGPSKTDDDKTDNDKTDDNKTDDQDNKEDDIVVDVTPSQPEKDTPEQSNNNESTAQTVKTDDNSKIILWAGITVLMLGLCTHIYLLNKNKDE